MTEDSLKLIWDAIVRDHSVTLTTHYGKRIAGKPLHVGPNSVWMVVGNDDQFVSLGSIAKVEPLHPFLGGML